jgi:hypothetical protein
MDEGAMNCKPGDLAIVVSAVCRINLGKCVTVIREATKQERDAHFMWHHPGIVWLLDKPLEWTLTGLMPFVPDTHLRPILPGNPDAMTEDEQEEMKV